MRGVFERVSPATFAQKVGIPAGWFIVSHRCLPDKKTRRKAHGRWFRIKSSSGVIYRILRFSPNLRSPGKKDGEIVLDWVGWLDLNDRDEEVSTPLDLEISEVPMWCLPFMVRAHPDPSYRLAGTLGLVSVVLGVLSVLFAFRG